MVITRKIEICVSEKDVKLRKEYLHTLYVWRDLVRQAANMIVSHKFVQQNVRDFMYFQEDVMQRFLQENPDRKKTSKKGKEYIDYNVSDTLLKGKGNSEQNTTYRLVSERLKGKVPADIYSCLNQSVSSVFKKTLQDVLRGDASVRSYKNNIPMPFSAKSIVNLCGVQESVVNPETGATRTATHYYFTLFGIPFVCILGQDRSNTAVIIDRCLAGEYKICSSSVGFAKVIDRKTGKKKQRLFLYLVVDIPVQEVKLDSSRVLYAYLGIANPIVWSCNPDALTFSGVKFNKIGTKKEFLDGRTQIQDAVRRCQISCRYSRGGRGRKHKLQAIQRFRDKEKNYVAAKIHTYSRMLVDAAVKNRCGVIRLLAQESREQEAKDASEGGDTVILRNWSYFAMKEKIKYKAALYGIKVVVDKEKEDADSDDIVSGEA